MKHFISTTLLTAFISLFAACTGMADYNGRLATADNLMPATPERAKSIIPSTDAGTPGDKDETAFNSNQDNQISHTQAPLKNENGLVINLVLWRLTIFFQLATILLLALVLFLYYKARRYNRIIEELRQDANNELAGFNELNRRFDGLEIHDKQIRQFVASQLGFLREITEACYHEPQSRLGAQVKKIVQFQHNNEQKWVQLYYYIDAEYNQIISKTREAYPQLDDKDLLLIALSCMGFSYIQIAIIMGYSNATSVSTIKQRLAKKMHLQGSLNDYINDTINR